VVSKPQDGYGGIFQYDFGKSIQDQKFQTTGFLNQPPRLLRSAVNNLGALYEENGHQLEIAISTVLKKNPDCRRITSDRTRAQTDFLDLKSLTSPTVQ
jgi:hypothetical protein